MASTGGNTIIDLTSLLDDLLSPTGVVGSLHPQTRVTYKIEYMANCTGYESRLPYLRPHPAALFAVVGEKCCTELTASLGNSKIPVIFLGQGLSTEAVRPRLANMFTVFAPRMPALNALGRFLASLMWKDVALLTTNSLDADAVASFSGAGIRRLVTLPPLGTHACATSSAMKDAVADLENARTPMLAIDM